MNIKDAIRKFYFDMSVNELRLMNQNTTSQSLTYNSLLYLDIITFQKNCTVSFIADSLRISKSAVTIKVNELIRQGLVEKTKSKKDRRIHYLSVSNKVEQEYHLFHSSLLHALSRINAEYSEEEVNKFCTMLNIISEEYTREITNE